MVFIWFWSHRSSEYPNQSIEPKFVCSHLCAPARADPSRAGTVPTYSVVVHETPPCRADTHNLHIFLGSTYHPRSFLVFGLTFDKHHSTQEVHPSQVSMPTKSFSNLSVVHMVGPSKLDSNTFLDGTYTITIE